jgi:tRNA nucleotidyltransferase (CCA-adding enzyme)
MKHHLPIEVKDVLTTLKKGGFEAYVVGGSVRDLLLNRTVKDWDFTTNATPEEILKLFPDGFYDNAFGTVGVSFKQKSKKDVPKNVYEITTFRTESGYTDHRHPDKVVWGKTLGEDLKRRDFTINALAFDGTKIIDLFDGQSDIENKIIRAVGDPDRRFNEDALRMMRAVRLATVFGFLIEEKTFLAIQKNKESLRKIASERVRDELIKILSSGFPVEGIKLLRNAGLLAIILPELEICFGVEQKSPKRHHIYDVGNHLLFAMQYCKSDNPIVRLATLLHDVGKPATFRKTADGVITFYNHEIESARIVRNIADRLRLSKDDRNLLVTLVRFHQFTVDERQTDSALRRFIRNVGPENIENMLALRTGDRLGGGARETSWRLELYKKRLIEVQKQPFKVADLKIGGLDVMKIFGITPGPQVGQVLNKLFNEVVEGRIVNERDELLKRIEDLKKENIPVSPAKKN